MPLFSSTCAACRRAFHHPLPITHGRYKELPINCAARNSVWLYPRATPPRFAGAPVIYEEIEMLESAAAIELAVERWLEVSR